MANSQYVHPIGVVINQIHNPIIPYAQTVSVLAFEFVDANGSRVVPKSKQMLCDPIKQFTPKNVQLFLG